MTIIYKMWDSHSTRFENSIRIYSFAANKADKSTNPNLKFTHILKFYQNISIS